MKKILTAICLILLCAMFIVSCDISSNYEDNTNYNSQPNINTSASSTTSNNNYNNSYNDNYVSHTPYEPETTVTEKPSPSPTPDEIEEFASETKPIPDSTYCLFHNWVSATCTKPKTCSKCGKTEGEPKGHYYKSYNDYKCDCGEVDPKVTETLAKCSLELPNLPQTLNYYGYNGSIYSSVKVTKITYDFEYYSDGKVTLTAKFSGTKTYDSEGTNQSDACRIGWKLYDPSGNVFDSGTYLSPAIAVGESFAGSDEVNLIYSYKAAAPGKYKLVLNHIN